jgi:hypothetical protein
LRWACRCVAPQPRSTEGRTPDQFNRPDDQAKPYQADGLEVPSTEPMSAQITFARSQQVDHHPQVALALQGLLDRLQSLQQVIGREEPSTGDRRHEAHVPRIAKIGSLMSRNPRLVVSNACCPTADKSQDAAFWHSFPVRCPAAIQFAF